MQFVLRCVIHEPSIINIRLAHKGGESYKMTDVTIYLYEDIYCKTSAFADIILFMIV